MLTDETALWDQVNERSNWYASQIWQRSFASLAATRLSRSSLIGKVGMARPLAYRTLGCR
jgi:hypothetical protein